MKLSRYFLLFLLGSPLFASNPAPLEKQVLDAMKKATDFMMNTVSNRGGFLWHYSADFSKQWGEVPALKSQIWVQPPSTPTVGEMLVEAYEVTNDSQYLEYAGRAAAALIWGQLPSGGWHYFIDFAPAGIQKFYDDVASQCQGWEEFYHYYGNATFDDDTTTGATRFLLKLYSITLDPKYRPSVIQALDFFLKSQYPNGAWPQRYPLRYDYPHDGHPDYTSFYTFNDGVTSNNIYLLLEAYEVLGNEEYRKAAQRGMDFYLLSQLPSPQAGWAQQYDMSLKPAQARSYEPAAVCSSQTLTNLEELQTFYLITGDHRYLGPLPEALRWLEDSVVNRDPAKDFTHAIYYELGTNKPLYIHHSHRNGSPKEILRFWVDPEPVVDLTYGRLPNIHTGQLRREYERLKSLSPHEARAEYEKRKRRAHSVSAVDNEKASRLISSMDSRGAWLTDIKFLDTLDYVHNPPTAFLGVDTATYVNNMDQLINFLKGAKR